MPAITIQDPDKRKRKASEDSSPPEQGEPPFNAYPFHAPPTPFIDTQIPADLRHHAQWVNWRFETRSGSRGSRRTKVPISAVTGQFARVNDPASWTSYERARAFAVARDARSDGLGFVFSESDPFVGVDLDDCRDEESGALTPEAQALVTELASYTEISPSQRGVKCIVRSALPTRGRRDSRKGVEIYGSRRFFTITGDRVGVQTEIHDRTTELSGLMARLFPDPVIPERRQALALPWGVSKNEIIVRARNAKNRDKFVKLFLGMDIPESGSASEGDLALCSILAFWAGPSEGLIDQAFRSSKRYRPKWDERHFANGATYGEETIRRAISLQGSKFYRWPTRPSRYDE